MHFLILEGSSGVSQGYFMDGSRGNFLKFRNGSPTHWRLLVQKHWKEETMKHSYEKLCICKNTSALSSSRKRRQGLWEMEAQGVAHSLSSLYVWFLVCFQLTYMVDGTRYMPKGGEKIDVEEKEKSILQLNN